MEELKASIRETAENFSISEASFKFAKESDNNTILCKLVDSYVQECYKNDPSEIQIIPIFNIFPSQEKDPIISIYFSSILISSLSKQKFSDIPDFMEFVCQGNSDKTKPILLSLYSRTDKFISIFDLLMDFSANFYSTFLRTYNSYLIPLVEFFFTNDGNCFEKLYNQIHFPPYQNADDIQAISNLMMNHFQTHPKLCSNLLEAIIQTPSENIPDKLNENIDPQIFELLTFLFKIMKNPAAETNYTDLLKYASDSSLARLLIKISEKYFSVSPDPQLKYNFIKFMNIFKKEKQLSTELTSEILDKMNPDQIEQAYKFVRELGRYFINHIDSPSLPLMLKSIQKWTEYCFENLQLLINIPPYYYIV